jgi:hypothetical protein
LELGGRVTERERLFITTQYYTLVTGQIEKANQEPELWIQEYPEVVPLAGVHRRYCAGRKLNRCEQGEEPSSLVVERTR